MDVLGQALWDYQSGHYTEDIITLSSLEEEDVLPLPYLFRTFEAMPFLEQRALQVSHGKVLDMGCGAGSHTLYLQKLGLDVTALDQSEGAIAVCRARGVTHTCCSDILEFSGPKFDTLLLMMNGIGLVGTLKQLPQYLEYFKTLLHPNGQILLDSSDIMYMFDGEMDAQKHQNPLNQRHYYGEVTFIMCYKKVIGPKFNWLYIDYHTLKKIAENQKFNCEMIAKGNHYDYLARLTLKQY